MFDEELVMMATKDLNHLLKKRNVPRPRQKDIKQRRRTLKNRYRVGQTRGHWPYRPACNKGDKVLSKGGIPGN